MKLLKYQEPKVDAEKFVINRSDILKAKSLALFPKDSVMPIIRKSEDKSMRGLRVTLDISIADGKERSWGINCITIITIITANIYVKNTEY